MLEVGPQSGSPGLVAANQEACQPQAEGKILEKANKTSRLDEKCADSDLAWVDIHSHYNAT